MKNFHVGGNKPAIIISNSDGVDDVRSYLDLHDDVAAVSHDLAALAGISTGDVALIVSPNHADYFAAVHGILILGGVISPANPMGTVSDICYQLEDCKATVVFTHQSTLEKVVAAITSSPRRSEITVVLFGEGPIEDISIIEKIPRFIPFEELKKKKVMDDLKVEIQHVSDDQLAVLPYSSGTTGKPKGVMLTHRNLVANVLQHHYLEGQYWKRSSVWGSQEVLVSPLPFSHVFGFTVSLNLTLHLNATLATLAGGFDMRRFLTLVQRHKCTSMFRMI